MSPATRTIRSVSPDADQRQIIALLMLTGQQFDEFKVLVWPSSYLRFETLFTAAKLLQKYLALADYVPAAKRCLVMELALAYRSQFEKLSTAIKKWKINKIGDLNEIMIGRETTFRYKSIERNKELIHTIFRTGSRAPLEKGTLSYITLKAALIALSQPNHKEFVLVNECVRHSEEPTLPTEPIIRPPRARRFSMVSTEDDCTKLFKTKSRKEEMRAVARRNSSNIRDDIAFEETTEPRFIHYCRASSEIASNVERWNCSRNIRNWLTENEFADIAVVHENCGYEVEDEQRYFRKLQNVNKRLNQKLNREFDPIILSRERNLI